MNIRKTNFIDFHMGHSKKPHNHGKTKLGNVEAIQK